MKNSLNILVLLPIIIFLSAASCKKDEIDAGFTCKVNGERWRTYVDDFKLHENECHLINNNEELFIKGRNTNRNEDIGIVVYTKGIKIKVGNYSLNQRQIMLGFFDENKPGEDYRTDTGYNGVLDIKSIDETNKMMTGTFYFDAYNEKTKQTVKITAGTFNLKYVNY